MKTRIVIDTRADGKELIYVQYHRPGIFGGSWLYVTDDPHHEAWLVGKRFFDVRAAKRHIDWMHADAKDQAAAKAAGKIVKTTYQEYP